MIDRLYDPRVHAAHEYAAMLRTVGPALASEATP